MGIISGIGAALGLSGAKIHIELPTDQFYLGTSIQGTVVLTGGNHPQVMNRLTLEVRFRQYAVEGVVVEHWWGYDYREYPVSREDTIAFTEFGHGQQIAPGERLEWPFALDIPLDCIPSQFGIEYALVGRADIPGAVDSITSIPIMILPMAAVPPVPPQPVVSQPVVVQQPVAPPPGAMPALLNPESRVMALWTDGVWYPGEVGQYDPNTGQYYIYFDDGSEAWIQAQNVQLVPMPLPPGTWVYAPWEGDYYPAQILTAVDGWYLVRWQADNQESYVPADLVRPM